MAASYVDAICPFVRLVLTLSWQLPANLLYKPIWSNHTFFKLWPSKMWVLWTFLATFLSAILAITPSLLILDLSTPTPPSNPISKLTCSVLQAFLAPNNTIHALLIHICMLILAPNLFNITLQHFFGFWRRSWNRLLLLKIKRFNAILLNDTFSANEQDWRPFQHV